MRVRPQICDLQALRRKKDEALGDAYAANRKKDEALEAKDTALKETRKTIDNYVETVQNAELLKEERFKPLMKTLLKDAMAHYLNFIDNHEHDDEELHDLAKALDRVAWISDKSGDAVKAIEAYRKSIEIRETLVAENPNVNVYRNDLAGNYNHIGLLLKSTGQPDEALASYKKALGVAYQ